MRVSQQGATLEICELPELNRLQAQQFEQAIRNATSAARPDAVHIDLAGSGNLDCAALGALIALRNSVFGEVNRGTVALAHPTPATVRLLALTQANRNFTISEDA